MSSMLASGDCVVHSARLHRDGKLVEGERQECQERSEMGGKRLGDDLYSTFVAIDWPLNSQQNWRWWRYEMKCFT